MTIWKLMEFMGTLPNKKRRLLISILEQKLERGELEPNESRILAASKIHPEDKRARRNFLKQELKIWEKRTA
ncbi:MAG: hypothetical protein AAB799_01780 [Patescibacteria group bacterium]